MRVGVFMTIGTSFYENIVKDIIHKNIKEWATLVNAYGESEWKLYEELPGYLANPDKAPSKLTAILKDIFEQYVEKAKTTTKLLAELDTWIEFYNYHLKKLPTEKITLHLYVVYTDESKKIAERVIAPFFKENLKNISNIELTDKIYEPISIGGVNDENEFKKSLDTLTQELWKFLSGEPHFDRKYLLISGGYKGFIPLISILGMMFPETYIVYKHEEAHEPVIISPMPITPDFPSLDVLRTVLQRKELEESEFKGLRKFFPFIENFYEKRTCAFKQTKLGELFYNFYKNHRRFFGKGEAVLSWIEDENIRKAIEEKLPYWEYLWIGDQIPETVEHSRRHSLRLLEYASHILTFFPKIREDLGDEGLAILYSSIWLHDFGHGSLFVTNADNTIFSDSLVEERKREIFQQEIVGLNPDLIRKFHNIYTVDMLLGKFSFLLPEFRDERLKEGVLLASLYHRKKMPLVEESSNKESEGEPLKEVLKHKFTGDEEFQSKVLLASALLSFIDGLDVQTDRVVSREYKEIREIRDKYEIDYHLKCIELYNGFLSGKNKSDIDKLRDLVNQWERYQGDGNLKNAIENLRKKFDENNENLEQLPDLLYHIHRILFIIAQKEHFVKHSLIDMVYLRLNEPSKELEIHLVENKDQDIFEKIPPGFLKQKKRGIEEDIKEEYKKSEPVLKKYFEINVVWT